MKELIPLIIGLMLIGCEPVNMNQRKAEYLCKDHGDVYTLMSWVHNYRVLCNDGTKFTEAVLDQTIIPAEELNKYIKD